MFSNIKGQPRAIKILKKSLENNKIGQAYLFYGPNGVGKVTTAMYLAMTLNCENPTGNGACGYCNSCKKIENLSHSDLIYLFPSINLEMSEEGEIKNSKAMKEYKDFIGNRIHNPWKKFYFSGNSEIRLDLIRMLQHRLTFSITEGKYRVVIIEEADKMRVDAANSFLKTLEEPPENTIMILTTSRPDNVLPTIKSRCQEIQFVSLSNKVIESELKRHVSLDDIQRKIISKIANGDLEKAFEIAEYGHLEARQDMIKLIDLSLKSDDINFLIMLEQYKTSAKKNQLSDLISFMIILFSDLSLIINGHDDIVNMDLVELLESIINANNEIDEEISEIIVYLEKMKFQLLGNVNIQLIFTSIYFYLNKLFV
jgi:DNA polymerase-3 subunit delta'